MPSAMTAEQSHSSGVYWGQLCGGSVRFSSVQGGTYALGKPTCAVPCLSKVPPVMPVKRFRCWFHWRKPFLVFQIQFRSRWSLRAQGSSYALHSVSKQCPRRRLWNSSKIGLTDTSFFVVVISSFKVDIGCFLFLRLSPPGDWRCDGSLLAFLLAGCVSSSSTLQIIRDGKPFKSLSREG